MEDSDDAELLVEFVMVIVGALFCGCFVWERQRTRSGWVTFYRHEFAANGRVLMPVSLLFVSRWLGL